MLHDLRHHIHYRGGTCRGIAINFRCPTHLSPARCALCARHSFTDPWTRTSLLVRQTHHGKWSRATQGHLMRRRRKDISLASLSALHLSSNAGVYGASSKRKWNSVILVKAPLSLAIGSRHRDLNTAHVFGSPVPGGLVEVASTRRGPDTSSVASGAV